MTAPEAWNGRARAVVWGFLVGVTLLEGWLIVMSFPQLPGNVAPLVRYTFQPPGTTLAWLLAGAATTLYVLHAMRQSPVIRAWMLAPSEWRPFLWVRLIAIPMAFVTGFFEEAFFRKFLMTLALHHGFGAFEQVVISAAAFGLAHGIWGLFSGSIRGALGPMIATGLLGAALAVVFLLGARSLAPCAAAHITINLFLEPWLIMTSAMRAWGQRDRPA